MATLAKTSRHDFTFRPLYALITRYARFILNMKLSRLGLICISGLIGSALGGITVMYTLKNHAPLWQFAAGVFITITNLVFCIAVDSKKGLFSLFLLTVIINFTLILINAF